MIETRGATPSGCSQEAFPSGGGISSKPAATRCAGSTSGRSVPGRRSTRIASRRPCLPRRSTRWTDPRRSVALHSTVRWCPSLRNANSADLILGGDPSEQLLGDAVPRSRPAEPLALLHDRRRQQSGGRLQQQDPAAGPEVERIQHPRTSTGSCRPAARRAGRNSAGGVDATRRPDGSRPLSRHVAESRSPTPRRFTPFSLLQLVLLGDAPGDTRVRLSVSPIRQFERREQRCVRGSSDGLDKRSMALSSSSSH